jgi:single-strand DNA-binding protein
MSGVNKVILVGNVGRDPQTKTIPSGKQVSEFSVATSDRMKDGTDKTEWHNIVAWDRLADLASKYITKGKQIYVEGKIQTQQWADKDGNKRSRVEILANSIQLLSAKSEPAAPVVTTDTPPIEAYEQEELPF